ncbi:MAG TPA: hypothetical protein VGP33_09360 [Chloroflexota bacterium]|nr:hypothetical protein [Chloroflexota bacterium]
MTAQDGGEFAVAVRVRGSVAFDRASLQVDEPAFSDPRPRVARRLRPSLCQERTIAHFNQQEQVGGERIGAGVEIVPRPEHGEVWLRLGVVGQLDRVLHAHDCPVAEGPDQEAGQAVHGPSVEAADRRHGHNLPINEFDTVVSGENPDLDHCDDSRPR